QSIQSPFLRSTWWPIRLLCGLRGRLPPRVVAAGRMGNAVAALICRSGDPIGGAAQTWEKFFQVSLRIHLSNKTSLFSPLQPRCPASIKAGCFSRGVFLGESSERLKPPAAFFLQGLKNKRHCRLAHAEDFPIGSMAILLRQVRKMTGLAAPLLRQSM